MKIPIKNGSNIALEVQLEPWLDIVLLLPGEVATLEGEFGEGLSSLEIEYGEQGLLSLYVPAGSTLIKEA